MFWWDKDGGQHTEIKFVDAETALQRAKGLSSGPAATVLEVVNRIIITDAMDLVCYEWIAGKGVVFP